MARIVDLMVESREANGKNAAGRVRRSGQVPAVVYGGGREPLPVQVDPRAIESILHSEHGRNTLIHLKVGDRELKRLVLIREIQRHPVTDRILHADFVRVEMDRKIEVPVPVHLVGTPIGVKSEGGMLDFVRRTVEIKVLPGEIPDFIEGDVENLHSGQHLAAGDLVLPAGAELLTAASDTIATVVGKPGEEEAAPAAPAEGEAPAEGAEPKAE